jgi:predicted CXXCH cytochrome family protein
MFVLAGLAATALGQATSVLNSKHNLSASGPGVIRATSETEICIFCHTPHNAAPVQPLWNRNIPVTAYTVYSSPSLKASPGQPTGPSKLCLSCHDGTIAVGSVLSQGQAISMAGGITTLPPGASNLGTDLSDDHPISFRYDADLVTRNPKLKQPAALPTQIHLPGQELQCTSCHDAHNDQYGKFLVMDNSNSQLCNSCHQEGATGITGHVQCSACHTPHTAPSKAYLLTGTTITNSCLACHSGQAGLNQGTNIATDLNKPYKHDTDSPAGQKDHIPNNSDCSDCHEPHTMFTGTASAPLVSPKLGGVSGVNASGATVNKVQYEYEVCFKCHGDQATTLSPATRQIVQNNTRLQFSTTAISFHPVEAAGRNMDVPTLLPKYTATSLIYCSDCHTSETSKAAGGGGPNGVHGSSNNPLLAGHYDTTDFTSESATAYELCYRCHDRNKLIDPTQAQTAFPLHLDHVVNRQTPCSACHDAHGISATQGNATNNSHLINFDTTIVKTVSVGGTPTLQYVRGVQARSGACTLSCHSHDHLMSSYGSFTAPAGAAVAPALRFRNGVAIPLRGTTGGKPGKR